MISSSLCIRLLLVWISLSCAAASTVVTTITAAVPTASSSSSYTSNDQFRSDILSATNVYRTEHNATALSWNTSLADYANAWASRCVFDHSHGPSGENLAAGYSNASTAIAGWAGEAAHYNYWRGKFSKSTGHFTQLVWKGTTSVGCGVKNCDGENDVAGWYVVCEYYPAGNVIGQFKQNVQPSVKGNGAGLIGDKSGASGMTRLRESEKTCWALAAVVSTITLLL